MRGLWPVPGALSGAGLAFHVYFLQPGLNHDTFAPLVFAAMAAFAGLLVGALVSSVAGWMIDSVMRRIWPERPVLASIITLVCLVGLVLGSEPALESALPSLIWPRPAPANNAPAAGSRVEACSEAAPIDAARRREWELECR